MLSPSDIKYPQHVEQVVAPDGRREDGAANDRTARQRRARSGAFLASFITAAAALSAGFFVGSARGGRTVVIHDKPEWNNETLATATRELAFKHCANAEWESCLVGLNEAKRLDPAGNRESRVQSAWLDAVPAVRDEGLEACGHKDWDQCLEKLDVAGRYDVEGTLQPVVILARSEALHALAAPARAPSISEAKH
jgi:hypothetical protein